MTICNYLIGSYLGNAVLHSHYPRFSQWVDCGSNPSPSARKKSLVESRMVIVAKIHFT